MSEEIKQPAGEETPETQTAPEQEVPEAEKTAKGKKKKEKGYTFTREQVEQMELAVKQLDSVKDQFVRLTAEYDNYRKRTTKEKDNIYQDAKADTIKAFLDVYDNLERAALYDDGEKVKEGLVMTAKSVSAVLEKLGVETVGAVGETFDPNLHNAVFHVEDESLGEGEIVEVFQKGYKKGNKIIRFAMVKTAN